MIDFQIVLNLYSFFNQNTFFWQISLNSNFGTRNKHINSPLNRIRWEVQRCEVQRCEVWGWVRNHADIALFSWCKIGQPEPSVLSGKFEPGEGRQWEERVRAQVFNLQAFINYCQRRPGSLASVRTEGRLAGLQKGLVRGEMERWEVRVVYSRVSSDRTN